MNSANASKNRINLSHTRPPSNSAPRMPMASGLGAQTLPSVTPMQSQSSVMMPSLSQPPTLPQMANVAGASAMRLAQPSLVPQSIGASQSSASQQNAANANSMLSQRHLPFSYNLNNFHHPGGY